MSDHDNFIKPLSAEEEAEAKRFAEIAERAERRALEKQQNKQPDHIDEQPLLKKIKVADPSIDKSLTFLSKKDREKLALERLELKRQEQEAKAKEAEIAYQRFITGRAAEEKKREEQLRIENER